MKKTALLAALLVSAVYAGEELVPATPQTVVTPAAPTPFALEATAGYNFAARDIFKDTTKVSTVSADLTGVWAQDENNAVTLRFGYAYGDGTERYGYDWGVYKAKYHVNNIYLMPGYRYTTPVADGLNVFAGVNLGVNNMNIKAHDNYGIKVHGSNWGFAYAAELGVTIDLSDTTYIVAAYQFSGNTAKPKFSEWGEPARQQYYHGLRLGVGCKF